MKNETFNSKYCIELKNEYEIGETVCSCYKEKIEVTFEGILYSILLCKKWKRYLSEKSTHSKDKYDYDISWYSMPNKELINLLILEISGIDYEIKKVRRYIDEMDYKKPLYFHTLINTCTRSLCKTYNTIRNRLVKNPYVRMYVHLTRKHSFYYNIHIADYINYVATRRFYTNKTYINSTNANMRVLCAYTEAKDWQMYNIIMKYGDHKGGINIYKELNDTVRITFLSKLFYSHIKNLKQ